MNISDGCFSLLKMGSKGHLFLEDSWQNFFLSHFRTVRVLFYFCFPLRSFRFLPVAMNYTYICFPPVSSQGPANQSQYTSTLNQQSVSFVEWWLLHFLTVV